MKNKNNQTNSQEELIRNQTPKTFCDKEPESDEEDPLQMLDICSATDCTGLIPSLPQSDGEITSYEELYHFLPRAKD